MEKPAVKSAPAKMADAVLNVHSLTPAVFVAGFVFTFDASPGRRSGREAAHSSTSASRQATVLSES